MAQVRDIGLRCLWLFACLAVPLTGCATQQSTDLNSRNELERVHAIKGLVGTVSDYRVAVPARGEAALLSQCRQPDDIDLNRMHYLASKVTSVPTGVTRARRHAELCNMGRIEEKAETSPKAGRCGRSSSGEAPLRRALAEFVVHYHGERNHQGLGNGLIEPGAEVGGAEGEIACRNRLGGLLRYYHRKAA